MLTGDFPCKTLLTTSSTAPCLNVKCYIRIGMESTGSGRGGVIIDANESLETVSVKVDLPPIGVEDTSEDDIPLDKTDIDSLFS